MAVKSRSSSSGQLLHFAARLAGLTGLMMLIAGLVIWGALDQRILGWVIMGAGALGIIVALGFEARDIAELTSSRRGAFGLNVLLQLAISIILVIGVNVFSFHHFRRFDFTRERIFTLDPAIRSQLSELRGDTDIIVYQQYVSFGQHGDIKQDKYDFAAQRKIEEKVKDLAELFGDLGPRFRVRVVDNKDRYVKKKLDDIEKNLSPELVQAIKKAPENSIFFYSHQQKQIQRLSFSDIYLLQKQDSIDSENLVLKYQGVEPFARKIFNIEEKKPHVATAVIHPVLGFQNQEMPMFTMSGAKKILDAYGFDTSDIMLRKLDTDGDLTEDPTVLSHDESRYEQIEDELGELEESLKDLQKELTEVDELYHFWAESSLAKLNTKYVYFLLDDGRQGVMLRSQIPGLKKAGVPHKLIDVDEDDRKNKTTLYKHNSEVIKHILEGQREERDNLVKEKATLKVENLAEKKRLTDIEAKAKAMLANVDLLILPRITLLNAPSNRVISPRVHRLDTAQLNAVKTFMKEGKPVLFLLGPTNDPRGDGPDLGGTKDQVEAMLAELGFKLPKQTILYNIEAREYNERKVGVAFGKSKREVEVPGLKFDDVTASWARTKAQEKWRAHAIRTSLKLMSRSTAIKEAHEARGEGHEVRVRHPRPVYYIHSAIAPEGAASILGTLTLPGLAGPLTATSTWLHKVRQVPDEEAVILVTREESWNEENPFIVKNKVPRFTPTKDDDPRKNTIEEERRGPFPIGVAVETTLPVTWFEKEGTTPPKARVAVIGSGGIFVGPTLPPLKEKMFLDVVNWLMGRDNLLARDEGTWQYPRVAMKPDGVEFALWVWGAYLGLPLAFIYLGTVVWMVRRMR